MAGEFGATDSFSVATESPQVRCLLLHSRYLSGSSSGENRVVDDEGALLAGGDAAVQLWLPEVRGTGARAAADAVWSRSAVALTRSMVSAFEPDVIHVHSLYPRLSPAVLRAAEGTPVVMTLHNFRLQCLPATFLRDERVCEDCLGRLPWRGVVYGCYRGSRAASAVLATSLTLHRLARSFQRVTLFVAVSEFVRVKLAEGGLDSSRVRVRRNFAPPVERRQGPGSYFLVLGRLSPEKGVDVALDAWNGHGRLVIVGDGPERPALQLRSRAGVEFTGGVGGVEASSLLRDARALLVPSRWFEGSPRVIVEAMAAGVPVVASDIGGLPEHVDDGVTGLLVTPDDVPAWAEAMERLLDDDLAMELGEGAYRRWQEEFSPEVALDSLLAIYREAIELHARAHG
jgi:glycosyltransferase involved in cell wall biosynthesis